MIALAVLAVALLGALAVVWRPLRRAPSPARATLRALLVVAGAAAFLRLAPIALERDVSGTRQCDLCGRLERVEVRSGVEEVRPPEIEARDAAALDAYAAWIAPILGEHEHAWARIGCWRRGRAISCTMREPLASWHVLLPRVQDAELGERAARAFLAADARARREWLELRDPSSTHGFLYLGELDDSERQAAFEHWLRARLGES